MDFAESGMIANIIRNLDFPGTNHEISGEILQILPKIYVAIMDALSKSKYSMFEITYCDPTFNKRILNPEISYEDIFYYRLQERLNQKNIEIISQGLIGNELRLLVRKY